MTNMSATAAPRRCRRVCGGEHDGRQRIRRILALAVE